MAAPSSGLYAQLINPKSANHIRTLLETTESAACVLNLVGKRDENALHAAVRSNVPETVALILSLDVDQKLVGTPNVCGETPLHIALKFRHRHTRLEEQLLEIITILVNAKGCIDLNTFSKPMWIERVQYTPKCMWRLNVLRFAIAHNQPESVLDLLEAHGAELGFDPNGTDKPRVGKAADSMKEPEGTEEVSQSVSRRLPFFIGLAAMDGAQEEVSRQQLMLKRYPHFIKELGAPTSSLLYEMMGSGAEQNAILERVVGNEVAVSRLSEQGTTKSPFVVDVMYMEGGGVDPALNVGLRLRALYIKNWYIDALMLAYGLSTHQYWKHDYRNAWRRDNQLELWELQAPVLFEVAALV